jgi:SAM-dependent methyltransferase
MSDDDDLVPSQELLDLTSDGTPRKQYKIYGDNFVHPYLVGRGQLRPGERVLEIGSGNGQKARALAAYLNEDSSYEGIEIMPAAVEWCQRSYRRFPNFRFQHADILNDMYNPRGKMQDFEYSLPFTANEFDFVFLCSVFTHMLKGGIARYIGEIGRVLKPGGRCLASFFLLNPDSLHWMTTRTPPVDFPHRHDDGCRLHNREIVSDAVAVDEVWVRERFLATDLRVTEVTYGHWSGCRDLIGGLQDMILAIKM